MALEARQPRPPQLYPRPSGEGELRSFGPERRLLHGHPDLVQPPRRVEETPRVRRREATIGLPKMPGALHRHVEEQRRQRERLVDLVEGRITRIRQVMVSLQQESLDLEVIREVLRKSEEQHRELVEATTDAERDVMAAHRHEASQPGPRDVTSRSPAHPVSLGDVAALAGQEITNPINGILNYARMLSDDSAPGTLVHDIAARIIREGRRIAHAVRDLSLLAQGEACNGVRS